MLRYFPGFQSFMAISVCSSISERLFSDFINRQRDHVYASKNVHRGNDENLSGCCLTSVNDFFSVIVLAVYFFFLQNGEGRCLQ